jgi:hypothetical protein
MKSAKYVLAVCTIILVLAAVYLKVTDTAASGFIVRSRYTGAGSFSTVTGNGTIFLAAIMATGWFLVVWQEKRNH